MDKPSRQAKFYPDGGSGMRKIRGKKAVILRFCLESFPNFASTSPKVLNHLQVPLPTNYLSSLGAFVELQINI